MGHGNFSDILVGVSRAHPGRAAIDSPSLNLTWRGFIERASQVARDLASRGVAPGSRVAIAHRRNEEVLVQMCALWMLGAVAAPIDFRMKAADRAGLARDFELAAILEEQATARSGDYQSIVTDAAWAEGLRAHPCEPMPSPASDAPALIVFTSGTSGKPQGGLLSHEALFARVNLPMELVQRDPGGRLLVVSPLSFCSAVHNTFTVLLRGGTAAFMPVLFSPDELARAIHARGITSLATVPTVMRGLLEWCAGRESPAFPSLKYLYCAGSNFTAGEKQAAQRLLNPHVVEVYATTATGRISFLDSHEVATHGDSVGRVLPQVFLQIVDESGRELPIGKPGRIRVRQPGMAALAPGIRARDADRDDGWCYTGDTGRVDADGFLYLMGRDTALIIRGGENVYPAEIERAAAQLAGVKEAVAMGYPSPGVGEDIALFVVAEAGITEQALAAHLRTRLVPNKVPRTIRLVASLPRNENGKVRYADLQRELPA